MEKKYNLTKQEVTMRKDTFQKIKKTALYWILASFLFLALLSSCASQGYQHKPKPCPCEKNNKR